MKIKLPLAISLSLLLTACGGGSDSTSESTNESSLSEPVITEVSATGKEVTISWQHSEPSVAFDVYTSFDPEFDHENYAAYESSEWYKSTTSPYTFEPSDISQPIFIKVVAVSENQEASSSTESIVARYVADNDTVTDLHTGITWSRCSAGMSWNASTNSCDGEALAISLNEAENYADNLTEPARLPTKDELAGIVFCSSGQPSFFLTENADRCDGDFESPTIYQSAFPNTVSRSYHTNEFYRLTEGKEFYFSVNFSKGQVGGIFAGEPTGKNLRLIIE